MLYLLVKMLINRNFAFKVWNEIQTWKNKEEQINDLSTFLQNRMNDEASVSAYLSIYNQITIDPINSLGILKTSNYSWFIQIKQS